MFCINLFYIHGMSSALKWVDLQFSDTCQDMKKLFKWFGDIKRKLETGKRTSIKMVLGIHIWLFSDS